MSRILRVSINPDLINKNETQDAQLYATGWENRELTPEQLADEINLGRAYCCQLSGRRKAQNFVCSDVISVDIDGTRQIDDALQDEFVRRHLTIFYRTPSHTEECPRFRLIFATASTISAPDDMVAAATTLSLKLCGDRSTTDAARIFYGSRGSKPDVYNGEIDPQTLEALIAEGKRTRHNDLKNNDVRRPQATSISTLVVTPSLNVVLANGSSMPFEEISTGTNVHCPFHFDRNASAFILQSRQGVKGLHCSTCAKTFWPPNFRPAAYDFFHFEKTIPKVDEYFAAHQDYEGLLQYVAGPMARPGMIKSNVHLLDEKYLSIDKLANGVTFIKSPKGTGKTEVLSRLLRDEDSVLLIGHRVSLIGQSSKRLDLVNYLDFPRWQPLVHRRLAVCLDSLHRLKWQRWVTSFKAITEEELFKTVVIDESEQVLSHFLSSTLEQRASEGSRDLRERIFKIFHRLLKSARRVVALDADLGWLTFETLTKLVNDDPKDTSSKYFKPVDPNRPVRPCTIYLNSFTQPRSLELFEDENGIVADLMQQLGDGKRVFVTSNSKRRIDALAKAIEQKFEGKCATITITSDTSQTDEIQAFIANIKTEALKYQAILTSPSMGTGVDIAFEDQAAEIDVVYGLFQPLITTHFEIDQQLARVRHPGAVKVWVSKNRYWFETSVEVIKRELQEKNAFTSLLLYYDEHLKPVYFTEDPFVDMAALATSQQRASKNDLKAHFIEHKRRQGFDIQVVKSSTEDVALGEDVLALGRLLSEDNFRAAMIGARTLRRHEFEHIRQRLENNDHVTAEDHWAMRRTAVELFYRETLSDWMLELDDHGRFRQSVKMFESLLGLEKQHKGGWRGDLLKSGVAYMSMSFVKDTKTIPYLLSSLLRRTPIYDDGVFDTSIDIDSGSLSEFAKEAKQLRPVIATHLDINVRTDVAKKPMMLLGALLEKLGLGLERTGQTVAHGKKTYRYRVSEDSLAVVRELLARRSQYGAWSKLYSLKGWPEDSDLEDAA